MQVAHPLMVHMVKWTNNQQPTWNCLPLVVVPFFFFESFTNISKWRQYCIATCVVLSWVIEERKKENNNISNTLSNSSFNGAWISFETFFDMCNSIQCNTWALSPYIEFQFSPICNRHVGLAPFVVIIVGIPKNIENWKTNHERMCYWEMWKLGTS